MRTGYADFWTLRRLNVIPKETSNYVPVILAMTIMSKNAKDYGLDDLEADKALEYETIELEAPTHMALIAEAVDRPISEIRELNPSLLRSVAPAGHALHVPKDTLAAVQVALKAVPANRRDTWRVHRLEGGETFATLAKRYGAAPSAVSLANHDELPEAGSWIAIPAAYPGDRTPARAAGESAKRKPAPRTASRRTKTPVRRSATGSHAPLS
jgi:membrane-bound lytic murein transglycosylase D